jgi:hypothetical protein
MIARLLGLGGNSYLPDVALVALAVMWTRWSTGPKHVVVVSRELLQILGQGPCPKEYAIREMGDASWDFVTGSVVVRDREDQEIVIIPPRFLGSARKTKAIASELEQRIRARGQS